MNSLVKRAAKAFLMGLLPLIALACASAPVLQPQINSLVASQRFNYALRLLEDHQASYGENNRLLYLLDYGLVLHLAGDYKESIVKFEEAKDIYEHLYTVSLSRQFTTWLINDYYAPYRGEDFERVMINIFQALNFAMIGDLDGALVEARDVDNLLRRFNEPYERTQKNIYTEDAFARLLMGILYEHKGSAESLNDAYISYKLALDAYNNSYAPQYGIEAPEILKQNFLSAAQFMGAGEYNEARQLTGPIDFRTLKEKKELAEVYLFYYYGFSPIKHQVDIPVPLPGGYFTKISFPRYDKRRARHQPVDFVAVDKESRREFIEETQLGQNISDIAIQNLDNRKARVIAKAVLRSGGKYMLERKFERDLRDRYGDGTADVFRYVSSLYNITSEQADLRSWQTLPGEIRLARLWLKPGVYDLYANDSFLGSFDLPQGAKKYIIVLTTR